MRCRNCNGRLIEVTERVWGPADGSYWMHRIDGGAASDCHLSAEPPRASDRALTQVLKAFWSVGPDEPEYGGPEHVLEDVFRALEAYTATLRKDEQASPHRELLARLSAKWATREATL